MEAFCGGSYLGSGESQIRKRYVIVHKNTLYEKGDGYGGPTCLVAGVEPFKIYDSYDNAYKDCEKLTKQSKNYFRIEEHKE